MVQVSARTTSSASVELVFERDYAAWAIHQLTVAEAASLARSLLSCAAFQAVECSRRGADVNEQAYLPTLAWSIRKSPLADALALCLSIAPKIELGFRLPVKGAKDLGQGLVAVATELAGLAERHPLRPSDRPN